MIKIKNKFTEAIIDQDFKVVGNKQSTIELVELEIAEAKRRTLEPPFLSIGECLFHQLVDLGIYEVEAEDGLISEDQDENVIY